MAERTGINPIAFLGLIGFIGIFGFITGSWDWFIFFTWFTVSYIIIAFFREHTTYTLIVNLILAAVLWVTIFIIGFTELRGNRTRF